MKETKLMRIYLTDEPTLVKLRRDLTRLDGEQASFADVITWLIGILPEHYELKHFAQLYEDGSIA